MVARVVCKVGTTLFNISWVHLKKSEKKNCIFGGIFFGFFSGFFSRLFYVVKMEKKSPQKILEYYFGFFSFLLHKKI